MDRLIVAFARLVVGFFQALPLSLAARIGRFLGGLAYFVDRRHRRVALTNLQAVYGRSKTSGEIHALARENFKRIGEGFVGGLCTAGMSPAELDRVLEIDGIEKLLERDRCGAGQSRILALGHFGNFEIFAMAGHRLPGLQLATTYRGLNPPALSDLLLSCRQSGGCLFFERRQDAAALRKRLLQGGVILGLLSDQNGGRRGTRGPFLGIECSTSPAAVVLARRFGCPLHAAICFRTGPGRWRIEISDAIPCAVDGSDRTTEAMTGDMNRILEEAVQRDPANWFWVHNRWRLVGPR